MEPPHDKRFTLLQATSLLSCLIHPDLNRRHVFDSFWMWGQWLEVFSTHPQLKLVLGSCRMGPVGSYNWRARVLQLASNSNSATSGALLGYKGGATRGSQQGGGGSSGKQTGISSSSSTTTLERGGVPSSATEVEREPKLSQLDLSQYLAFLFLARLLELFFWYSGYGELGPEPDGTFLGFNLAGWTVLVAHWMNILLTVGLGGVYLIGRTGVEEQVEGDSSSRGGRGRRRLDDGDDVVGGAGRWENQVFNQGFNYAVTK